MKQTKKPKRKSNPIAKDLMTRKYRPRVTQKKPKDAYLDWAEDYLRFQSKDIKTLRHEDDQ